MNRKQSQQELSNWIHNFMNSLLAISDKILVKYLVLKSLIIICQL